MEETQSKVHVIDLGTVVKGQLPPVDVARPAHCSGCKKAAYDGSRCRIHGHGVRGRTQRGPLTAEAEADCRCEMNRRYECQDCGAVMAVMPVWTAPFKHFTGAAIGMALALWGMCGQSAGDVRERVNDRRTRGYGARGWRCLARWAGDAGCGQLFAALGVAPQTGQPHTIAERVAQALCGCTPRPEVGSSYEQLAFAGACHVS